MTTNARPNQDVGALMVRLTAELGEVTTTGPASAVEYRRSGQPFTVVNGKQVSLRLRQDIAEAALRTPGTSPCPRGDDWIDFEPDPSNQQDIDRLQAWLTIGWRAAQRHN